MIDARDNISLKETPHHLLAARGFVVVLFATMIVSKRCRLEVCGDFADASGNLFVLHPAGIAPPCKILVELGVIDSRLFRYLLRVETIEIVEERAEVVFVFKLVFGQRLALAFVFFPHQLAGFHEAADGFLGRFSHTDRTEVLIIIFNVTTESTVRCHFNDYRKFFLVPHNYNINGYVVISLGTIQTTHPAGKAELPGHISLSEQSAPDFPLEPFPEFLGVMPRYGFLVSRYGAEPNIMFASMTNQKATCLLQFLYELLDFHKSKELINNTTKVYKNITSCKFIAIFLSDTIKN